MIKSLLDYINYQTGGAAAFNRLTDLPDDLLIKTLSTIPAIEVSRQAIKNKLIYSLLPKIIMETVNGSFIIPHKRPNEPDTLLLSFVQYRKSQIDEFNNKKSGKLYSFGSRWCGSGHMENDIDAFTPFSRIPRIVEFLSKIPLISVSKGVSHSLVLSRDDRVFIFGDYINSDDGYISEPQLLPSVVQELSGKNIVKIVAGNKASAAISQSGDLYMWGDSIHGRLGLGDVGDEVLTPTVVSYFRINKIKIIDVSLGFFHTLAITSNGDVYSWGDNRSGQLGFKSQHSVLTPMQINLFSNSPERAISVSAGAENSLVLTSAHNVWGFGNSGMGQLGVEPCGKIFEPIKINSPWKKDGSWATSIYTTPTTATGIWSQTGAGAVITQPRGEVYTFGCYGLNIIPLGHGKINAYLQPNHVLEPTLVNALVGLSVKSIFIGQTSSHVLLNDGRVFIWGENCYKFKDDYDSDQILPAHVETIPKKTIQISAMNNEKLTRGNILFLVE